MLHCACLKLQSDLTASSLTLSLLLSRSINPSMRFLFLPFNSFSQLTQSFRALKASTWSTYHKAHNFWKTNTTSWLGKPPTQGIQWESNAMTLESVVILRAWPVRHTFDCQRSAVWLVLHWFHTCTGLICILEIGKVSSKEGQLSGCKLPRSTGSWSKHTVVHLSSAYVRETGKMERTSKFPG